MDAGEDTIAARVHVGEGGIRRAAHRAGGFPETVQLVAASKPSRSNG